MRNEHAGDEKSDWEEAARFFHMWKDEAYDALLMDALHEFIEVWCHWRYCDENK
jgi:hypothetical protein